MSGEHVLIVFRNYTRSRRWTWRRFHSARRGARISGRQLVRLVLAYPAVNVCAYAFVPMTFWRLLIAPNLTRPWRQTVLSIVGHPIESIEAIYVDGRRVE